MGEASREKLGGTEGSREEKIRFNSAGSSFERNGIVKREAAVSGAEK